jgi:hypothetical protein
MTERLPSWRAGSTRDALIGALDRFEQEVPVEERVAAVDNDGTMWCERPSYIQLDFFLDALQRRVDHDPSLARRPALAAALSGDMHEITTFGLEQVAAALVALFEGQTPGEFATATDEFLDRYRHPTTKAPIEGVVYQPMLELLDELRRLDFSIGIVTGGGTEFVRQVSKLLYGVEPGMVVGTLIGYRFDRDGDGRPSLRRTGEQRGSANEGGPKVEHIQSQIGRPPVLAIGNSPGDTEMLEWAQAHPREGVAALIHHDDDQREFAYESTAATFDDAEPITSIAARLGWVIVSMARDWDTVFASG